MKLNPNKYAFDVEARKFIGYLVSQRGIKANPDEIAIVKMKSPKTLKQVHMLIDKLSLLIQFISRATNKSHFFSKAIR